MAQYERGGQLSEGEVLSIFSTQIGSRNSVKIQGRKFILRYEVLVGADIIEIEKWFQSVFEDLDLKVTKSSWSQDMQMFLILLSSRRKLTVSKWRSILQRHQYQPRIVLYESALYQAFMNEYNFHWPQRYPEKLNKLIKKSISIDKFVEQNITEIKNLTKLNQNIEFYDNLRIQRALSQLQYEKKRGIWLYGKANSGKTTMAIKYLEGQPVYFKDMTTETFDNYKGESNIFLDELNRGNSRRLLPILKNLVNCIAGRFNVKFSTRMIYPKNVIVTTQYELKTLTTDEALIQAIKQRFHFYYVERQSSFTKATQYSNAPNDIGNLTEIIFDQQLGQIMPSLEYFKLQIASLDEIERAMISS